MLVTVTCKECNKTCKIMLNNMKELADHCCKECGKKTLVREFKGVGAGQVMTSEMVGISQMMVNNGR